MTFAASVFASALALVALATPGAVLAHAKVVASSPAEGALVKGPKVVSLSFSHEMVPAGASVEIVMTAMPGMPNHGDMPIRNFTAAWSEGNRKVTLTLRQPLRTGTYDVRWQAAGADGHKMSGKVTFDVK
jgi:hypothetical protein